MSKENKKYKKNNNDHGIRAHWGFKDNFYNSLYEFVLVVFLVF